MISLYDVRTIIFVLILARVGNGRVLDVFLRMQPVDTWCLQREEFNRHLFTFMLITQVHYL